MLLIFGLGIGILAVLFTSVSKGEYQDYKDADLNFKDASRELDIGFSLFSSGVLWLMSAGFIVAFFCLELPFYGLSILAVILAFFGINIAL